MKHAAKGASSMYRWMKCPGSLSLCEGIPNPSSKYAQEGTDAHLLAELALKSTKPAKAVESWLGKTVGTTVVTEEMVEAVSLYVSTIMLDWGVDKPKNISLRVEEPFNLDWLLKGYEMFGTNDACLSEPFGLLRIYDLKYGAGVVVEVENNPQLLYYALGALGLDDYEEIEIVVVQPRAPHVEGPIRRWRITQEDLLKWAKEVLVPAAVATEKSKDLAPGDHCKFCPAKKAVACPAIRDHVLAGAQEDFSEVLSPSELSNEDLAELIIKAELLVSFVKDCKELALNKLKGGEDVPGFKLVQKRAYRKWASEEAVEAAFGSSLGDALWDKKIKSPSQIEKIVKKENLNKEVFSSLLANSDPGVDIAPVHDKRPGVPAPAFSDFEEAILLEEDL